MKRTHKIITTGLLTIGALTNIALAGEVPSAGFEDIVKVHSPFTDIDPSTVQGMAAIELYERDIIGGFPDGTFRGEQTVNRAEAAKFLLRAHYGEIDELKNNKKFPDVLDNQWYTKYVVTAAEKNIINGYPSGYFHPARTVNAAEFLKMLSKTFELEDKNAFNYEDVSVNDWFAPYAGNAQKYNLFPSSINNLYPGKNLTRNDVAIAILQILTYQENANSQFIMPTSPEETPTQIIPVGDDPALGKNDAPVTIVEFTDYQCPFCQKHAQSTFPLIKKNYIDTNKVKYVVKDFPLAFHERAFSAANAANCANEQGRFWEMKDKIFNNSEWHSDNKAFTTYATDLKMNLDQFSKCTESEKYNDEIKKDIFDGEKYGVSGTPNFFINGIPVTGAYPYEHFEKIIESELKKQ